jgi:anthranilate 1,2-dioxygenase small subunit
MSAGLAAALAPAITLAEVRSLLAAYTAVLDDGDLVDWPTLFTDPCLYRITTRENERQGYPLPIMLCDNRAMLYDRVEATEKANVFEPHWYRHILSESQVVKETRESLVVKTGFICVRTMQDGPMTLFVSGAYIDDVVRDGETCRFRSKSVILDQSRIDTLIAIPL